MTRLADALERAGARQLLPEADPAPRAAAPVTAPPISLVNPAGEGRAVTGTTLLAPPLPGEINEWRRNPEWIGKLVGTDGFSGAALEQYRKLAATLHHANSHRGLKVIMTSSALPGEGKSLTAANVALTLSTSYQRRVVLIDADLRRPSVQRIFGIPPMSGLTEGLKAERDTPMTRVHVSDRLAVMPAGRPDPDPIGGLTSDRMRRLVAEAMAHYDWVIVDTPPIGLLPDAGLLTSLVGGVLLVVRCGKAPYALVKRTVEAIGHERIQGVVMNAVDFAHDRNAGGYYEYYGYGYYGAPTTGTKK